MFRGTLSDDRFRLFGLTLEHFSLLSLRVCVFLFLYVCLYVCVCVCVCVFVCAYVSMSAGWWVGTIIGSSICEVFFPNFHN